MYMVAYKITEVKPIKLNKLFYLCKVYKSAIYPILCDSNAAYNPIVKIIMLIVCKDT